MSFRSVVKKFIPAKLFHKVEPYGHLLEAMLAQVRYGFPARNLKVIGVTGTSGKTTTTTLIASVLRQAGFKTASFTTLEDNYGDSPEPNPTRMTTVGVGQLLRKIKRARQNGAEWMVLEVTSHALNQRRVWGIPFDTAVFTNITHEHLDYHATFDNYKQTKGRLFKQTSRNPKGLQLGIINADDDEAAYFAKLSKNSLLYGLGEEATVRATDVQLSAGGSTFKVVSPELEAPLAITTNLPGRFNVSNSLAAVSVGLAYEIAPDVIAAGIAGLQQVTGRMARYETDKGFTAVIDFAHTPDSFEKIFKEFRPLTKGKLVALFGCAGERDQKRRYLQGTLAADYCERIILTEDDPRSEDNSLINAQIREGIAKSKNVPEIIEIEQREDAIDKAVELAEKGDVLLLLSKGHERSIELADGPKPWDEVAALQAACKHYGITLL